MMPTIERFHCIQHSQLGPNGVLYRADFNTMQPMRLNATQSTVLKNTYLHLHFTPRQIWNLDCAYIIYIILAMDLYTRLYLYMYCRHICTKGYSTLSIFDSPDTHTYVYVRMYITVSVLLIHTYCVRMCMILCITVDFLSAILIPTRCQLCKKIHNLIHLNLVISMAASGLALIFGMHPMIPIQAVSWDTYIRNNTNNAQIMTWSS